jgi:uncharacterized coiled-coil protein SlyX
LRAKISLTSIVDYIEHAHYIEHSLKLEVSMKSPLAAIGLLLMFFSPAFAQSPSIQQQLAATLKALSAQLAQADTVVAGMHDARKKGSVEAQLEVTKVATALGELADRLQDQGDVMGELQEFRAAAQANQGRVAHLEKGTISEVDRTNVLRTWTKILEQVDAAQVRVKTIRDKILAAITELRRRQVGLSEEILAGSYEDAIKSLNEWLGDLQKTIDQLRASVAVPGV